MNQQEWIEQFRMAFNSESGFPFTELEESFLLSPRERVKTDEQLWMLQVATKLMENFFYKQAAKGKIFGVDVNVSAMTPAGDLFQILYKLSDGPFIKLARAYWSFYREIREVFSNVQHDLVFMVVLDIVHEQVATTFFPTVDLPMVAPAILKQRQAEILSEYFSTDDVDRFLKESPVLRAYSGIGGIVEHNLYKFLRHVNIIQPGFRERLNEWASLGGGAGQGLLAGDAGNDLAHFLAKKFNHNFDDYDKAIDAAYNAGVGGSSQLHHLIDGQHSIFGALHAVGDVSPDDTIFQELYEACEHLLRDLCSVSGINPIFSISRETFDSLAEVVAPLGVNKLYLVDALTVNAPEMIGAVMSLCSVVLGSKSLNSKFSGELSGSMVVAMLASANPALLPVAGYSMYQALKKCENKEWGNLFLSLGKGALVTGATITVSHVVGGNWMLKLVAGVATAIFVRKGIKRVENSWDRIFPAFDRLGEKLPGIARDLSI